MSHLAARDCSPSSEALRKYIILNDEVREALASKRPIVALESTVLSHGLPYPENLELANSLEDIVRKGGCVPCTIALLDGKIHFGLTSSQIERLALAGKKDGDKPAEKIHKASVRDLAWILSTGASGATTVAATSFLANLIDVSVFATGGIGGVHRDGHITMDVSADLVELSRSPVIVVCAGAKSILDIGRTLEYLETLGVPVIGYQTDEFPAFFTRTSGIQVPLRLDSPLAIAKLMKNSIDLGVGRGVLVGVPISKDDEADAIIVEKAIQQALNEAEAQKVTGREITPFILSRVSKLTGGHSLKANIALLQQNTRVASAIALELNQLRYGPNKISQRSCCPPSSCCATPCKPKSCPPASSSCSTGPVSERISWSYTKQGSNEPTYRYARDVYRPVQCQKTGQFGCRCGSTTKLSQQPGSSTVAKPAKGPVFVIGGIAVDVLSKPGLSSANTEVATAGLSIPGSVQLSAGGVARNIAETLVKFGVSTTLVSALGSSGKQNSTNALELVDFFGRFLLNDCAQKGIKLIPTVVSNETTAVYSALSYSDGKFRGGVAHMSILDKVDPSLIHKIQRKLQEARFVVLDANLPASTIAAVLSITSAHHIPVLFDATSAAKVIKLAEIKRLTSLSAVTFLKPNVSELVALANALRPEGPRTENVDECLDIVLGSGIQHVILTLGAQGVKFASKENKLVVQSLEAEKPNSIVEVNGAGDSLAAGFVFGYMSGLDTTKALRLGIRAARLTIESTHSVSPKIGSSLLTDFASPLSSL